MAALSPRQGAESVDRAIERLQSLDGDSGPPANIGCGEVSP
jgi:hypothetical protein